MLKRDWKKNFGSLNPLYRVVLVAAIIVMAILVGLTIRDRIDEGLRNPEPAPTTIIVRPTNNPVGAPVQGSVNGSSGSTTVVQPSTTERRSAGATGGSSGGTGNGGSGGAADPEPPVTLCTRLTGCLLE